jgi:hypothetical protein
MRHTHTNPTRRLTAAATAVTLALAGALSISATAQQPLYDDAPVVIETLSVEQLQDVVGPIALYPDDLLAVVLPASAYPLQIVQAARFLDDLERDDSLQPDPEWDESVVALLNYPEVLRTMSNDLDWTYDLGTAVVNQQADVIDAIDNFRDLAYSSGNLKTDDRQVVAIEDDHITITPVEREVIYVPQYEPERVIVVQREPVFGYYPHPFPLYYYPYTTFNRFHNPYFFGVSTAFGIGWGARNVNVLFHNYAAHPFFGRPYLNRFYYHHRYQPARLRFRPLSNSRGGYANVRNRNYRGDQWRPVQRRNVRSLGRVGQRARVANVSRGNVTRTLKPRDPRQRNAAIASSRRGNFASNNRTTRTRSNVNTTNRRQATSTNTSRRQITTQRNGQRTVQRSTQRTTQRTTVNRNRQAITRNQSASRTTNRTARPATTRTRTATRTTTTTRSTTRAPRQSATRSSAPRQSAPARSSQRSAPSQRSAAPRSQSRSSANRGSRSNARSSSSSSSRRSSRR